MAYIYSFRDGFKDKSQLGNKGANLVEMTLLGLPVPPGFIIKYRCIQRVATDRHLA